MNYAKPLSLCMNLNENHSEITLGLSSDQKLKILSPHCVGTGVGQLPEGVTDPKAMACRPASVLLGPYPTDVWYLIIVGALFL